MRRRCRSRLAVALNLMYRWPSRYGVMLKYRCSNTSSTFPATIARATRSSCQWVMKNGNEKRYFDASMKDT